MADISKGPVSSMPGSLSTPPAGAMCDDGASNWLWQDDLYRKA